jgi:signal transduction histidine kinase
LTAPDEKLRDPPLELALLAAGAVACVTVLALAVMAAGVGRIGELDLSRLLPIAVASGAAALVGAITIGVLRRAKRESRESRADNALLRQSLTMAEAVLRAEPQVLLYWEHGERVRVVTHTLLGLPGLPSDPTSLLRFEDWLDAPAHTTFSAGLTRLLADGRPFNAIVKTRAGAHLEADGRASGGRAILRLRDVAGHKADLVRVLDVNELLARDAAGARRLLESMPFPVWIRDATGVLEWANAAYVRALELPDLAAVVARRVDLLEPRQREAAAKALADGREWRVREPLIVGGEQRPHDVTVLPFEGGSLGFATDASALVSVQGEFDRRVASYDRTLDRVATAVAIYDTEQRLTFHNAAFESLWCLDPEWLATRPTHGEVLDRLRAASRLPETASYREWKAGIVAPQPGEGSYEDWWHLPDQRTLHVIVEPRAEGGVTCLYDDVSEHVALGSRYNALIDVQRETLDHLAEGVAVFGTDGRLRLFNSAFAGIWRLSRRMLGEAPHVDEIIRQCRVLHEDARAWTQIGRDVTVLGDHRHPGEGQMTRADGSVIDFATLPLPDGGTLVTFNDVTVSKRYERALIERNDALVAADQQKSQFIRHISYELRTPLTNIIGFGDMLVQPWADPMSARQQQYVEGIAQSSRQLLAIIDDMLDLATIDAGALELKPGPVHVPTLLEAAVLSVRDRALRDGMEVVTAVGEGATELIADEGRLRQVLYNLLSNAIGFSQAGDRIELACRRDVDWMVFTVTDHGAGIPEEQLQRILERFESRSRGSRHRGAGLGLAVVKSLVQLHKGTLQIESEPGRGTRVTMRLPIGPLTLDEPSSGVVRNVRAAEEPSAEPAVRFAESA